MLRCSLILVLILSLASCVYSTLHFFPAIVGIVTLDGEPIEGVSIKYSSTTDFGYPVSKIESYKTDEGGRFRIPLKTYTGIVAPHIHKVESKILIYYRDKIYTGLVGVRDYMNNNSIDTAKPIELQCELANVQVETIISNLNGDRYGDEKNVEYSYSGICL